MGTTRIGTGGYGEIELVDGTNEPDGNKYLIAAAPEMLEALTNVLACLCENDPRVGRETKYARMRREYVLETVNKALAKAKGVTP